MAVAVVLVAVATLGLARRATGLERVAFFALLIAYPLGLARAVPRLRPRWQDDRLSWLHALPLLLHALVGLWGALGVLAMALQGTWGERLEAILAPGLTPAAFGLAFGWLLGLALATRIDGVSLFVRIAFFVPLGLLVLVEIVTILHPLGG
jgi:hypothetical protein